MTILAQLLSIVNRQLTGDYLHLIGRTNLQRGLCLNKLRTRPTWITTPYLASKQDAHTGNWSKRHLLCIHIRPDCDVTSPIYGYERSKNTWLLTLTNAP